MIYPHNSYHPINVITTKGVKEIRHIQPYDQVYDYCTGKPFTVRNTFTEKINKIFNVTYSDGRTAMYSANQHIYLGDGTIRRIWDLIGQQLYPHNTKPIKVSCCNIPVNAIEYSASIQKHPYPDPCVAGALLTFGYYDDKYINLPSYSEKINNLFSHRYNVDYALKLGENGRVYFTFKGGDGACITWDEMFPRYNMYAVSKHFASPVIPDEYTHASIFDRWKYVRGVFDIGYDRDLFPDKIVCMNESENRLKYLQKMLWSLGVLSKIEYFPSSRKRNYKLEIIGDYARKTDFFYDDENLRHTLCTDNMLLNQGNPDTMTIKAIQYIGDGVIGNIISDNGPHVYYTDNFLPRLCI